MLRVGQRHCGLMIGALCCILSLSTSANTLDALAIMKKHDALPEGKTAIEENVLVIIKGKQQQIKKFDSLFKRYGKKRRMHIAFSSPTRLEFLVWDEPGLDSLQWLKMSSGRVRKIATSDKGNTWVSSDFYNEDLSEFNIEDHEYTLLGESDIAGIACYKIESRKTNGSRVYSKRIHHIGKDDYVLRRVEFYENGKHSKTLNLENIERIEGVYTARKAVMTKADGKSKSILYLQSVKYNLPIKDSKLTRETF